VVIAHPHKPGMATCEDLAGEWRSRLGPPINRMLPAAFVLSDGRLALLGQLPGILGVDGAQSAAVWDPVSNSLDTGENGTICPNVTNIGPFAVSGDRTRIGIHY